MTEFIDVFLILAKKSLLLETMDEDRMSKIAEIERYAPKEMKELQETMKKPEFVTPLKK